MTPDRPPPEVAAWRDQFGALIRDKVRQLQNALLATNWTHMSHEFTDTWDGDEWRLTYRGGHYWITNLSDDPDFDLEINIEALGVNRR